MKLTGVNQLWIADLNYIRLQREFVYLAVILDAFSRRVVGWELGRTLTAQLPMAALEKAVLERQPLPGLVHRSDRGTQYARTSYVALLRQQGLIPQLKMSRSAASHPSAWRLHANELAATGHEYSWQVSSFPVKV